MPCQCEMFTQSNIAKIVSQAMNKILKALILMYISFNACAKENTIEGFWASSGVIIEVKVCHELICAEIVHVFTEDGIDPLTVLDENNREEELRDRPLIGINMFDEFRKEQLLSNSLDGGKIYDPRRGRFYDAELSRLESGNLLVEGCLLFICDGEEWLPLDVTVNPDGSRNATPRNNADM